MKLRLYYPTKPWKLIQAFGENAVAFYKQLGLLGHNGEDAAAYHGQPVYAAHDGVVTFAGEDGSGGYGIVLRTNEKYEYNDTETYFKTIYWHLLPGTFKVTAGQTVNAGTLIARADNTGLSTGDHLHFGVKPVYRGEHDWEWFNAAQDNGFKGAVDPEPYWTGIHAVDVPQTISLYQQTVAVLTSLVSALQSRRAP